MQCHWWPYHFKGTQFCGSHIKTKTEGHGLDQAGHMLEVVGVNMSRIPRKTKQCHRCYICSLISLSNLHKRAGCSLKIWACGEVKYAKLLTRSAVVCASRMDSINQICIRMKIYTFLSYTHSWHTSDCWKELKTLKKSPNWVLHAQVHHQYP